MSHRPTLAAIFALFVVGGGNAEADSLHQFDLICEPDTTDQTSHASSALEWRYRIDLDSNRFCQSEEDCVLTRLITRVDANVIEYHCVAGETFCRVGGLGTAGPFILKEDLVIDRADWSIRGSEDGTIGDIAARPYNYSFVGKCRIAPFSGFPRPLLPNP